MKKIFFLFCCLACGGYEYPSLEDRLETFARKNEFKIKTYTCSTESRHYGGQYITKCDIVTEENELLKINCRLISCFNDDSDK